ncbi:uncharacterized protein LOC134232752 [Saccostrea cucullata]|uniref:uncharacterized protein LOC134232752 n=1 Tax=Saccostrea cuccullata TaxID=36930 RepID=UPI002ED6A9DE
MLEAMNETVRSNQDMMMNKVRDLTEKESVKIRNQTSVFKEESRKLLAENRIIKHHLKMQNETLHEEIQQLKNKESDVRNKNRELSTENRLFREQLNDVKNTQKDLKSSVNEGRFNEIENSLKTFSISINDTLDGLLEEHKILHLQFINVSSSLSAGSRKLLAENRIIKHHLLIQNETLHEEIQKLKNKESDVKNKTRELSTENRPFREQVNDVKNTLKDMKSFVNEERCNKIENSLKTFSISISDTLDGLLEEHKILHLQFINVSSSLSAGSRKLLAENRIIKHHLLIQNETLHEEIQQLKNKESDVRNKTRELSTENRLFREQLNDVKNTLKDMKSFVNEERCNKIENSLKTFSISISDTLDGLLEEHKILHLQFINVSSSLSAGSRKLLAENRIIKHHLLIQNETLHEEIQQLKNKESDVRNKTRELSTENRLFREQLNDVKNTLKDMKSSVYEGRLNKIENSLKTFSISIYDTLDGLLEEHKILNLQFINVSSSLSAGKFS